MTDWAYIASTIGAATGTRFQYRTARPVSGGSINQTVCLESTQGTRYFVKLNDVRHTDMFSAEADGLAEIAATNSLRVPEPIVHGNCNGQCFLVLEYLELGQGGDASKLGMGLANLHRHTAQQYGLARANFIGTTPQANSMHDDWIEFWRENRLGFQLKLAGRNGYNGNLQESGAKLNELLPVFFSGYRPQASLLHGDLWGGNHAYLPDGNPTIFDPAIYYGDREADIAMTELFGGFSKEFYAAYRDAWLMDAGYGVRRQIYNLYHILNHANLFGGGYIRQAENMMQRLIAEAG